MKSKEIIKLGLANDLSKFTSGVIGEYNACIVNEVFAFKKNSLPIIIYTLISVIHHEFDKYDEFKAHVDLNTKNNFLNSRDECVIKNYSFGIKEYTLKIEEAKNRFHLLLDENKWQSNDNTIIDQPYLQPITSNFVMVSENNEISLNYLLRNNFFNGSYIIEFFDPVKEFYNKLFSENQNDLDYLDNFIKQHTALDIKKSLERFGSIIFQFPSISININIKNFDNMIEIETDIEDSNIIAIINNKEEDFGVINPQTIIPLSAKKISTDISYSSSQSSMIYDLKNKLILHAKTPTYFISGVNLNINLIPTHQHHLKRIFNNIVNVNNTQEFEKQEIDLLQEPISQKSSISNSNNISYRDVIRWKSNINPSINSWYQEDYAFKQFAKNGILETKLAFEFIHEVINKFGNKEICLWDPYCTTKDIVNTIFFCHHSNIVVRVIADESKCKSVTENIEATKVTCVLQSIKKLCNCFSKANKLKRKAHALEYKLIQQTLIQQVTNNNPQYINIEYRVRNKHIKFHDRFLICIDKNNQINVWSLGTSINSLGKNHHIISLVSKPHEIYNSFNALWDKLDSEENLIWKI